MVMSLIADKSSYDASTEQELLHDVRQPPIMPPGGRPTSPQKSSESPRVPILSAAVRRVKLAYYRYELTYGLYILNPREKAVLNTLVIVFLALFVAAIFIYLPPAVMRATKRLSFYAWGELPAVVSHFNGVFTHLILESASALREKGLALKPNATAHYEL